MIQESIDQCLMITKSVTKRCRADNNNNKQNQMNKSRTLLNKKRALIEKDSFNSKLIGQHELNKKQISIENTSADYVHKLSSNSRYKYRDNNKIQKSKLKFKSSKLFKNMSTSTLIRGHTNCIDQEKFSFLDLDQTLFCTKQNVLLNSTQMDKKEIVKFSAFCQDSDYASNGSSDSECPTCMRIEYIDCMCEACDSNVFRNESWNKTNFLSSTPLIIDYKANMNSTENTSKRSSSKKKTNGFKLIQKCCIQSKYLNIFSTMNVVLFNIIN